MNNGITVICPTYKNPKYLDLFLESFTKGKKLDSTEMIVSVDGFIKESQNVLNKYKDKLEYGIKVLDLGENRGMSSAINLAVYQATNDKLLIVNDDNVFPIGFDEDIINLDLRKTVYTLEQIETIDGMFNFTTQNFGKNVNEFQYETFINYVEKNKSNVETDWGRVFPLYVSKQNFSIVNGFDTLIFDSPNVVDWDVIMRWELMGLSFKRTYKTMLYHFGSISTKVNAESNMFRSKESIAIDAFKYKWGFPIYNGLNNTKIHPTCPYKPHTLV